MSTAHPVVVVGGGLVGALFAVFLAQRGFKVEVYERRHDTRKAGNYEGRSINLAISDRGLAALDAIGVGDAVRNRSIRMPGRLIHPHNGSTVFQPYGKPDQAIMSISRQVLNELLLNKAEEFSNISLFFDAKCLGVDVKKPSATFQLHDEHTGSILEEREVHASFIAGCDGAFSAVRAQLQKLDRFEYSQTYLSHGYKELRIPPLADGSWAMPDFERLHIWPRKSYMLIALPNPDKDYTATIFLPFEGSEYCFSKLNTPEKVTAFFQKEFPDVLPLMPTLLQDWFANPHPGMVMVHCANFHYKDKVILLGDAAHAIVPFYGQGCNCGFEDCSVFEQLLNKFAIPATATATTATAATTTATVDPATLYDLRSVFAEFTTLRKVDAKAILDLAVHNFYVMRDGTVDPWYQAKTKVINFLHKLMPSTFIPLYTMVTFSPHIRYSEAMQRSEWQDRLIKKTAKTVAVGAAAAVACYAYTRYFPQVWKDAAAAKISSAVARMLGASTSATK